MSGRPNKWGLRGVSRDERFPTRWHAHINVSGTPEYLGSFETAEAAHLAYLRAAEMEASARRERIRERIEVMSEPQRAATMLTADYYTEAELASELGVSQRTIARWRGIHDAPPITRIGHVLYYRKAAVREWLEKKSAA